MVDVGPASASASNSGSSQNNSNSGEEDKKDERMFECNICLDTAKDAVVSMCGHLFCWPCLHQWLETRPARQMCPVCKAAISKEKVIPLYGRGSSKQEDPRNKAPPRPAGQRSEPEANTTEEDQSWSSDEESSNGWEVGVDYFIDSSVSNDDSAMEEDDSALEEDDSSTEEEDNSLQDSDPDPFLDAVSEDSNAHGQPFSVLQRIAVEVFDVELSDSAESSESFEDMFEFDDQLSADDQCSLFEESSDFES